MTSWRYQLFKAQGWLLKKFVKRIRRGVCELRTEFNSNIFCIFFIFGEGRTAVLFNGFQKKTQKAPNTEIEKAIK